MKGRSLCSRLNRLFSLRRLAAVVRKEVFHICRDPRTLFLVTVSPAFLLFLLSYIFSLDISHFRLALLDLDRTSVSRSYVSTLTSDGELILAQAVAGLKDILPLLRAGDVDAGLVIPPGFADAINGGQPVQVEIIVDGTDPFGGKQVSASLGARSTAFAADTGASIALHRQQPIEVRSEAWYNAGLQSLLSMVPGLMAIVLLMPTLAFSLALAREKETGTLEGLLVTPVSGLEYIAGKLVAYIAAGLVSTLLALLVATLWFKVPFRGSLGIYLLLAASYFLACMAVTLVLTNFVKSQQTAMFVVLLIFLVPSFFLAGLISPVSTASLGSMLPSYVLPSTHFVQISRTMFLKGLGLSYMPLPALILLGTGLGGLLLGLRLFRKRVA
jgi:ABC-2 type transport system permease protein